MLKMILTTIVALYAGFIIWGKPQDSTAVAAPETASAAKVSASDANFDRPVILSREGEGEDATVTSAAVTQTVVPESAAIAAATPAAADVTPRRIGDPVVVSLVRPTTAPEAAEAAETEAPSDEAPAPADVEGLLRVSGSAVNMRSGPSTGTDVVDNLPTGTLAEPIGPEVDGWIEIRDVVSGLTGYMASRFLDPA